MWKTGQEISESLIVVWHGWLAHVIVTSKFRELLSPARQQIWPCSRSKVTIEVTTWYHWKGLVTKNTDAKYQSSICNSANVMTKVKNFCDRQTDGWMRFNVPTLSRKQGTKTLMPPTAISLKVTLTSGHWHKIDTVGESLNRGVCRLQLLLLL